MSTFNQSFINLLSIKTAEHPVHPLRGARGLSAVLIFFLMHQGDFNARLRVMYLEPPVLLERG